MHHISPAAAASLLQWWSDAGVDCLVDEAPRDWLRPAPAPLPASVPATEAPQAPTAPEAEPLPDQLDLFQAWLAQSENQPFAAPGAPRVCPSGDPASGLMLVTDMPALEDCESGMLLSGEPGRLFDRMLAAMGRSRSSIYLSALSCFRSPGGGFNGDGARQCATLARHHVGLAQPRALLLLGDTCAKALLGLSVIQARGRWHTVSTHAGDIPALATFHPSYLLDQPAAKRHAWADLQMLMEKLA